MKTPFFGKYNPFYDDGVHVLASLAIACAGYLSGLGFNLSLCCLAAGYLLDIDHLLNPLLAKMLGLDAYKDNFIFGSNGYTIKILHGFDVALFICTILTLYNPAFSAFMFLELCIHEIWDFVVYPFTWKELFLITRIRSGFRPGKREAGVSIFFDKNTVNC